MGIVVIYVMTSIIAPCNCCRSQNVVIQKKTTIKAERQRT